ncbi:MAG TPA: hypothetical protein VFZ75_09715 [Actinomycetota bacterium]|nr:hypothetical protein [Actinomycetota bacterium]
MNEARERTLLVVGAIVLALSAIGSGALIARSSDDGRATEGSIPTLDPTSSPTPAATPSPTPAQTPSETPVAQPSASPVLADGRHFVYVTDAARRGDRPSTVTFDLGYFYRGERAEQEAAERGDEVVNDIYIVNENPRLRTLPLGDIVVVRYIPVDRCCDLQDGDVDAWLGSILGQDPTDYPGKDAAWWFRVDGGRITRIEQQFLP